MNEHFTKAYWIEQARTFRHALGTRKFWRELVMMTLGMSVGAAAVYYFLMPSHLIIGTISGLSIVINTLIGGDADTFSYLVMGINAFLLLLAFLLIGNEFGAKTVYTAMILGPLTQLWDRIYPYTNFTHRVIDNPDVLSRLQAGESVLDPNGNPYLLSRAGEVLEQVKDTVMSAGLGIGDVWFDLVCFVFLLSACQAIEFRINASTGGLDILAKIINKYLHFDIGASVSIGGALICCSAFLINDFRMVVIGLIGTWINGLVIDYFTASFSKRKRVCIISSEYEQIRDYIVNDLVRGCTLYEVRGGYGCTKKIEIQSLLTQDEFAKLMAFIRANHLKSFITAGNCSEVYGLWLKHKKGPAGKIVIDTSEDS
ncbi:MAG: YitT family protein [Paludibacteraceae bacterium]|nr:YitT family protein [Paludibacteraceae bacterium]